MKEKLSLIFKILIVIVSGIGLYLNFCLAPFYKMITYFTIQSNLMCFIFFLILVILLLTKKIKKTNKYYIIKGMVTMSITVTMVIYQIILTSSEGVGLYVNNLLESNLVHLIVPLMVIFDYIVFSKKGNLKPTYPFYWSIILIIYLLFNIIYVSLGGTFINGEAYPYFYMNIDKYGYIGVFINCLILYLCFIGYGFLIQFLDNKLANKKETEK